MDWFTVDKAGLAKLLERKGKSFVIFELLQNAWDTEAKVVGLYLKPIEGSPYVEIRVEDDDPDGFKNIAHAFTLFAESEKKADPTKRGRFNLGEKLVLALCRRASIESTTGAVHFDDKGRHKSGNKRAAGSEFWGEMRMTRVELNEVLQAVRMLIPPDGVTTLVNGEPLPSRPFEVSFFAVLPTEIADEEGILRRSERTARVSLHPVRAGETAHLYELGIPVVETDCKWHVNVHQKIPLNADRDNVTPAYLRRLRTAILNQTFERLSPDDATTSWVRDASADPDAKPEAVERVITHRFGEKRVIFDPTDPEGTKLAVSKGYTVITGGSLSAGEWANVKKAGAALPAGQVTPSPKPYDPKGNPERVIPRDEWTIGMQNVERFARGMARVLLGCDISVRFVREPQASWAANYGECALALNVGRLGKSWFDRDEPTDLVQLLIHEFGHHYSMDHLSEEYHDALCSLGARLAKFMQGKTFDVFSERR